MEGRPGAKMGRRVSPREKCALEWPGQPPTGSCTGTQLWVRWHQIKGLPLASPTHAWRGSLVWGQPGTLCLLPAPRAARYRLPGHGPWREGTTSPEGSLSVQAAGAQGLCPGTVAVLGCGGVWTQPEMNPSTTPALKQTHSTSTRDLRLSWL